MQDENCGWNSLTTNLFTVLLNEQSGAWVEFINQLQMRPKGCFPRPGPCVVVPIWFHLFG